MNTRNITYTERLKQEFKEIRDFYAERGTPIAGMRRIDYAGKYRIEMGTHGFYATFKRDASGKIVGDVQTIN